MPEYHWEGVQRNACLKLLHVGGCQLGGTGILCYVTKEVTEGNI